MNPSQKYCTKILHKNIVNIYVPNIGALIFVKLILTDVKGEKDSSSIILGDVNTPLTSMYKLSRQKINKEICALNKTLE